MSLHRLRRDPSFCAYLILLSVQLWGILQVQIFLMKGSRGEHHCMPHCETRTAQCEAQATDRFVSKYGARVAYSSNFLHPIRWTCAIGLDIPLQGERHIGGHHHRSLEKVSLLKGAPCFIMCA